MEPNLSPGKQPKMEARASILDHIVNPKKYGFSGRAVLYVGLFWVAVGLLVSTLIYGGYYFELDKEIGIWPHLRYTMPQWFIWVPLTFFITDLAQRFPVRGDKTIKALIIHTLIAFLLSSAFIAVDAYIQLALLPIPWEKDPNQAVLYLFLRKLHINILIYGGIVAFQHAVVNYRRAADRERDAVQLHSDLVGARLEVLRHQLNPHFLFNTLNAVGAYVYSDPDKADAMLADLGELLRIALKTHQGPTWTLAEEWSFCNLYLKLQKNRFADRLHVEQSPDKRYFSARVPVLLLQPLLENALEHGIGHRARGGSVTLRVTADHTNLCLEVTDNGPGLPRAIEEGIGLSNTRSRLHNLYGEAGRLRIENRTEGGCRAAVFLPLPASMAPALEHVERSE